MIEKTVMIKLPAKCPLCDRMIDQDETEIAIELLYDGPRVTHLHCYVADQMAMQSEDD